MPRSEDLVPLLLSERKSLGMRQGKVIAWDSSTGENTIRLDGVDLANLPVLASTGTVLLAPGDVVGLLRYKATYFVLGRIGVAGEGALAIRAASVTAEEHTTSSTYTDLPTPGPTLNDVYIGSTRRCLVFISVEISVADGVGAAASFQVSGASSIAPVGDQSASFGSNAAAAVGVSSFIVLDQSDGLNEGLNTFHMLYRRYTGTGTAAFRARRITVLPF